MDQDEIRARLPASIATRVQTAKFKDGVATLVLDAAGLGASGREKLEAAVKDLVGGADAVEEVRVAMIADRAPEPAPRRIIAIGSGKGGVGKSTLTANLAVALARMGRKVGVVDADIYGPSQPTILANKGERPKAEDGKLIPVPSKWGVSVLSMGHLVEPGKAIAWRGPMAGNALGQLIDAHWGDAEVLLVDLPPGTGDVQLSMLQKHKPAGAIIVSTPQDLALIDAQRAANLFETGKIPLIGLVENMAGYACPHCGEISDPFGRGGVEDASEATGIPFLGRIPLAIDIREDSDAGTPTAAQDGPQAEAFAAIARSLSDWLDASSVAEAV
ncbi:Mrp/NBP35 family ATP-binding protein [Allopontixanthobacter sediminis]|uniref:Iron-sulfur cluster carrier protein n=1 Tax=Allopontixanthobacter sediminis TaxID=1689985 RepID=A0A845B1B2_9SPHN|nr:Mrp/NBP35 family ATP-binding protein [Allopontixanthobacter sediminis]MXP45523.1 P-loop NTPase [Allopontixanthobacter sediminis]